MNFGRPVSPDGWLKPWSPWRIAMAIVCLAATCGSVAAQTRELRNPRASSNVGDQVRLAAEADERPHLLRAGRRGRADEIDEDEQAPAVVAAALPVGFRPEQLVSPEGLGSTLNLIVAMTVLSLAPSILIMTTCFVRFAVVLGLLRQALGTQQLPPNQVLMALCLFLTFTVMSPVWQKSYDEGIRPYTNPEPDEPVPTLAETFGNSVGPIRWYMGEQIKRSGNGETVWMFVDHQRAMTGSFGETDRDPENYQDLPLPTLVSSFLLSELKTAFLIGFQIYLPFLVIDLVVATVLTSMGMMMVPPTLVSFPFKLLLFVLIDGWTLTVGMMLESVRPA
jgi:flagellar biosynthetic protein FliP